jgi:hypothetical protein
MKGLAGDRLRRNPARLSKRCNLREVESPPARSVNFFEKLSSVCLWPRSENPKGISPQSPGSRGTSYPGSAQRSCSTPTGPTGLRPEREKKTDYERCQGYLRSERSRNPRWGCDLLECFPRVARTSQPWALGRNPVGIFFRRPHSEIHPANPHFTVWISTNRQCPLPELRQLPPPSTGLL